jgi:hypothetical protein
MSESLKVDDGYVEHRFSSELVSIVVRKNHTKLLMVSDSLIL